jgi:hypothetical protein
LRTRAFVLRADATLAEGQNPFMRRASATSLLQAVSARGSRCASSRRL